MGHLFACFTHENIEFVMELASRLESVGVKVWFDREKLRAVDEWRAETDQALQSCSAVLAIMTPTARASQVVTHEWSYALGIGKRLVPLMLKPTDLHPRLAAMSYYDFTDPTALPWSEFIAEMQRVANVPEVQAADLPLRGARPDQRTVIYSAIEQLESPDVADRLSAVEVLAKSGHPLAQDALRDAMHGARWHDVRVAAAFHLVRTMREIEAIPLLLQALPSVLDEPEYNEYLAAIAALGSVAREQVAGALADDEARVRWAATQVLAEMKDVEAVPALLAALEDPDGDVRWGAAEALTALADPRALDGLAAHLKDEHRWVRQECARALAHLNDGRAVPALIETLADSEFGVKETALRALGEIHVPEATDAVLSALEDDGLRWPAAEVLSTFGARAVPGLQQALFSSNSEIRRYAAWALGEIRAEGAVADLAKVLMDENWLVSASAESALRRIGTNQALQSLEDWRANSAV
mgnify:CR=1 FL=1